MVQFKLYVHGVPIGHEIYPRDTEEAYLRAFYNHDKDIKETAYMQIEAVNGKTFYTYLHKRNVSSEIGRPGSYLGITVCFQKQYCTNVCTLYELLETLYKKICIGSLIKQESGNERFLVKEIASAQIKGNLVVDYLNDVFKQNAEKFLSASFDNFVGSSASVDEMRFSLEEVDSPLFRDAVRKKRVLVSPEYASIREAYNNLQKEIKPLREEHGRFKRDNVQLRESNVKLIAEAAKLQKDLSNAETSASKKYKSQIDELNAKYSAAERDKKQLEDKIKKATEAVDLIDDPVKKLTRLLASRFPEESNNNNKYNPEKRSKGWQNNTNKFKTWFPLVNFVLLLCILAFCGYGYSTLSKLPKNNMVAITEDSVTTEEIPMDTCSQNSMADIEDAKFEPWENCTISIEPSPNNGIVSNGVTYNLSVKQKGTYKNVTVPLGQWNATSGVTINGNTFVVDSTKVGKNIQLFYMVDNKNVITRTVKVN